MWVLPWRQFRGIGGLSGEWTVRTETLKRQTQAERREEAISRMIEATIKLIAENGYHGFSLADVGSAAGYSRGLPTHYFGRKEDLLAIVAKSITDQFRWAQERSPAGVRGLPAIAQTIRRYGQATKSVNSFALGILIAEAIVQPLLRQTITALNEQGLADITRELKAGIRAGNIRPDLDVNLQAKSLFCFMRGLLAFATSAPDFDAPAVAEHFVSTLIAGIGTEASSAPPSPAYS